MRFYTFAAIPDELPGRQAMFVYHRINMDLFNVVVGISNIVAMIAGIYAAMIGRRQLEQALRDECEKPTSSSLLTSDPLLKPVGDVEQSSVTDDAGRPVTAQEAIRMYRMRRFGLMMGDGLSDVDIVGDYLSVRTQTLFFFAVSGLMTYSGWSQPMFAGMLMFFGLLVSIAGLSRLWLARARLKRRFPDIVAS